MYGEAALNRIYRRCLGGVLALLTAILAFPAFANPHVQHWQLDNGAGVYFVEAHELPMVDVQVTFNAGSAHDGAHPGLASLTNNLLDDGAGKWDANGIADELARLGAQLSTESLRDMAVVSLRTLSQATNLEPAADLLAAVIAHPTFPPNACERERAQTLVAIADGDQSPDSVATRAFYQAIYGDHPYGHPPLGTAASVSRITRDDLVEFHHRYYVGHNAVVVIVGDLDRTAAAALAVRVAGGLEAGETPTPLPVVSATAHVGVETIPFPTAQTHVFSGQPGTWRGDPDYFPLYVGNHILGGSGLVSRISQEIREKRGLSYAASSEFSPMRVAGPFAMSIQTRNNKVDDARRILQQTLETFVREGPTQEELMKAKENIMGGFALSIDSNSKVAAYLTMMAFYGLPLDYLDRFKENIAAVTVAQIRDAFQRRIDPAHVATVIVGGK